MNWKVHDNWTPLTKCPIFLRGWTLFVRIAKFLYNSWTLTIYELLHEYQSIWAKVVFYISYLKFLKFSDPILKTWNISSLNDVIYIYPNRQETDVWIQIQSKIGSQWSQSIIENRKFSLELVSWYGFEILVGHHNMLNMFVWYILPTFCYEWAFTILKTIFKTRAPTYAYHGLLAKSRDRKAI